MATPRSPYGELEQHLPALHMASRDTIIPLAIWRAEAASSRSPRPGSPYGEQGRLRPARHMASMIALHQCHALSSRLHSFVLQASAILSLDSSRLELPLELYDKNHKDLFSRISSN
ncbi:hypothetical protein F2Q70_00039508 [Brassica cretica]|uniref:Uncharacterized protein n=1 Tax=Brassica cretica TaxID=69181 RepID=A0A3N6U926_BRACR|nr:hypothetical protein F2Q70_00039508 [Brassica cretica]KAF3497424.1 hypothetical protein DY000_02053949 [Brassica cretica]